jgi:hypothetical protein
VARQIRERYPEAYEADLTTSRGDKTKLGTFSKALTADGKTIFNVYSQFGLSQGIGDRATLYDMVDKGLRAVELEISHEGFLDAGTAVLGIPYMYGCALGGGTWAVVEAIIKDVFATSPVDVLICEWPPKN